MLGEEAWGLVVLKNGLCGGKSPIVVMVRFPQTFVILCIWFITLYSIQFSVQFKSLLVYSI